MQERECGNYQSAGKHLGDGRAISAAVVAVDDLRQRPVLTKSSPVSMRTLKTKHLQLISAFDSLQNRNDFICAFALDEFETHDLRVLVHDSIECLEWRKLRWTGRGNTLDRLQQHIAESTGWNLRKYLQTRWTQPDLWYFESMINFQDSTPNRSQRRLHDLFLRQAPVPRVAYGHHPPTTATVALTIRRFQRSENRCVSNTTKNRHQVNLQERRSRQTLPHVAFLVAISREGKSRDRSQLAPGQIRTQRMQKVFLVATLDDLGECWKASLLGPFTQKFVQPAMQRGMFKDASE
jgi:hypothetical protein